MKIREQRRKNILVLLLVLFCSLGLGYALLRTNLSINGTSKIKGNTWDIHFDNLVVNTDSVELSTGDVAATIQSSTTEVSYTVTLNKPGDFYEFTVDAVNAGSVDGMIDSVTSKLNDESITTLPSYLNYSVSYSDGVAILPNQYLKAGESETYKVRVEFKKDVENSELPSTNQTLSFDFSVVYIQADNNAIAVNHPSPLQDTIAENIIIDNVASTYVTNENGVQFDDISSDTNGKGIYLRAGTENDTYPIYYYRGDVDNNHLLFANLCWRIVRTTNTGGLKLLYDGIPSNGECNNTGQDTHISITGTSFNTLYNGQADVGYMYGTRYTYSRTRGVDWYYGPDVTYENGTYTLRAKGSYNVETKSEISGTNINYQHYTCGSTTDITCTSVRYVYHADNTIANYITLTNGKKVEDALSEMLTNSSNENNSTIKTIIDTWYQNNMTSYTNMLEDTIWCNDRSIGTLNGWNPDGGRAIVLSYFSAYNRAKMTYSPSLECTNKNDSFTVRESLEGNGKLTYPVGLLTSDEVMLAGGKFDTSNTTYYLNNGTNYWLGSPSFFRGDAGAYGFVIKSGSLYFRPVSVTDGVRPVVSLKIGTQIARGSGTSSDPYIVE